MKKLISMVSVLALSTSLFSGTVMAANGADYSTDFADFQNGSNGIAGWTFNGSSSPWFGSSQFSNDNETSIVAGMDAENKNLKLVPTSGYWAGAIYDAGITNGVYKMSFRIKKSDDAVIRVRATDTKNESNVEALYITAMENVVGKDGKAISKNQNGDSVQFGVDTWNNVDFIINMNTKEILRFVDGRGVHSISFSNLENFDKILIGATEGEVCIDDFSLTKLEDEEKYAESTSSGALLNTNFTQYIDHAFNTNSANNNDNLTLGNAAWRGGAYTTLTDRGVSMKLTKTSYNSNGNDLYFKFPNAVTDGKGVYAAEVWIKPVTTQDETKVSKIKVQLTGTATKELQTDESGKVTGPAATKDKKGLDLKLNMDQWNKIELVNDLNNDVVYAFLNGYGCGSIVNGSTKFDGINVIASNNCDVYVDDLMVYAEDAALYGTADTTDYIEKENFNAAGTKVSNAGNTQVMNFNKFSFGNAAWRGSVHATKTDKGISLCMGDPTENTLTGNKYNDVTWVPASALSDTDGKYVIEFDERFDTDKTSKMTIKISDATEFVFSADGGLLGSSPATNFNKGKWNHAKITVDLANKTAVFNINGNDAKTVETNITSINKVYIQTANGSGVDDHGDIIIDNFSVKKVIPLVLTKTETGAKVKYEADSNVTVILAAYDAQNVMIGCTLSSGANGEATIDRAENVSYYKAFMWKDINGESAMVPVCDSVSVNE